MAYIKSFRFSYFSDSDNAPLLMLNEGYRLVKLFANHTVMNVEFYIKFGSSSAALLM
jgi:hypothetical protein